MTSGVSEYIPLFAAAIPFIYFLIVLYSASRYFAQARNAPQSASDFTPPVSNLKPVRGLDPEATYRLHLQTGQLADDAVERASGDYWMHHGVAVSLRGDFQAAFFTLEREGN